MDHHVMVLGVPTLITRYCRQVMGAKSLFVIDLELTYPVYCISFPSFPPWVLIAIFGAGFIGICIFVVDVGIISVLKPIKIKIGEIIRISTLKGKAIVKVIPSIKIPFDRPPNFVHITCYFFGVGGWIDVDIVHIPIYIIGIVIGIGPQIGRASCRERV